MKYICFLMILMKLLISSFKISSNIPEIYNINKKIISINPLTLEHIFPKCYMNKNSYNDLHNIFLCNKHINNIRSNYKYTDLDYTNINLNNFSRIYNSSNYICKKYKLFIPENDSKGIIARTIMYMCYEYNYKYNKIIDYENLINWCLKYPPSKSEIYHNHIVFMKQYKRNKFIDLYNKKNYKRYIENLFS
jgi:endonuclease I